jgi:hypothetical protein
VWNEHLVRQSVEQPLLLADAVRNQISQVAQQVETPQSIGRVASRSQSAAPSASLTKDQLAATPTMGQKAEQSAATSTLNQPIELASNRGAVEAALHAAAGRAESQRQRAIQVIGGASVCAALVVFVLMGTFAALRITTIVRAVAPALIAAVASLLIGLNWIDWLPLRQFDRVAMSRNAAPLASVPPARPPAANETAHDSVALPQSPAPAEMPRLHSAAGGVPPTPEGGLQSPGGVNLRALSLERTESRAPAALYFNPQLMTDADGRATIRFNMPPVDSEYRLLIDALGHGRFGSRQELIICGPTAAK